MFYQALQSRGGRGAEGASAHKHTHTHTHTHTHKKFSDNMLFFEETSKFAFFENIKSEIVK